MLCLELSDRWSCSPQAQYGISGVEVREERDSGQLPCSQGCEINRSQRSQSCIDREWAPSSEIGGYTEGFGCAASSYGKGV